MSRIIKVAAIVLIVVLILLVIAFIMVKPAAERYIAQRFGVKCVIGSVFPGPKTVTVRGMVVEGQGLSLTLPEAEIDLDLDKPTTPLLKRVMLKNADAKITNLALFQKMIEEKLHGQGASAGTAAPPPQFRLELIDSEFVLENPEGVGLDIKFSIEGIFSGNKFSQVDALDISECNIYSGQLAVDDLTLHKQADMYKLSVASLSLKGRELKDLEGMLSLDADAGVVIGVRQGFIGWASLVDGVIEINDYHNMCVYLDFGRAGLGDLAELLAGRESLTMTGEFKGSVDLCMKNFKIADIKGGFKNSQGGFVNIKKEADMSFLDKYMDKKSQDTVVDSLRNYTYNKSDVKVSTEDGAIIFKFDFSSEEAGKRNIVINFHDMAGGAQ
ncbi:YdbH domain-containing protein [Candidatus Omnitrophota bacterium]